jgi:hypothetical protein
MSSWSASSARSEAPISQPLTKPWPARSESTAPKFTAGWPPIQTPLRTNGWSTTNRPFTSTFPQKTWTAWSSTTNPPWNSSFQRGAPKPSFQTSWSRSTPTPPARPTEPRSAEVKQNTAPQPTVRTQPLPQIEIKPLPKCEPWLPVNNSGAPPNQNPPPLHQHNFMLQTPLIPYINSSAYCSRADVPASWLPPQNPDQMLPARRVRPKLPSNESKLRLPKANKMDMESSSDL